MYNFKLVKTEKEIVFIIFEEIHKIPQKIIQLILNFWQMYRRNFKSIGSIEKLASTI